MEPALEEFSVQSLPQSLRDKVGKIAKVLNEPVINVKQLREVCRKGIPDEASYIRSVCWKLLLNYLPEQREKWPSVVASNEKTYSQLVKTFLPPEKFQDYPLVLDKSSPRWQQLQGDFLLWQQIEKDTSRTHADLAFFSSPSKAIMIPFLTGARKQKHRMVAGDEIERYHEFMGDKELQRVTYKYHIMTRILFVYSKLNPRIGYVQGMNEILAPIFYLVNHHKLPTEELDQASCFFMLNNAVSTVLDMHMKDLDSSDTGIQGKVAYVDKMLFSIEPSIWKRLDALKIQPFFYCFRWLSLLYAQEFQLFDVLRLWDSMFSHTNRVEYANYVAIALLCIHRESIMKGEFIQILEALQNIKFDSDIEQILAVADKLQEMWSGKNNFEENYQKGKNALKKDQHNQHKAKQQKNGSKSGGIFGLRGFLN